MRISLSDASNLRILLQSSDGSIEFDPAPDDEDGTFEINQSPPDSKTGQFYLETSLVGRLPISKKANLTVILQGQKQPIKRSIAVQIEAGEATRFVFANAATNEVLGEEDAIDYTSGQPLGLRLLAVDDSGNKVAAFSGQKAVVTLKSSSSGGGGGGDGVKQEGDASKELQVDMIKGEGDLAAERWFTAASAREGEISVKAARNAGLAGVTLKFPIKPGKWLSEIQLR